MWQAISKRILAVVVFCTCHGATLLKRQQAGRVAQREVPTRKITHIVFIKYAVTSFRPSEAEQRKHPLGGKVRCKSCESYCLWRS